LPEASDRRRAGHGVGLKNGSVYYHHSVPSIGSNPKFYFLMDRFGIVLNENFG
jgi:hypothetical protein